MLVSALARPARGGEAVTEFASTNALAAVCVLRGDKALMVGGIIKARQSMYGVI